MATIFSKRLVLWTTVIAVLVTVSYAFVVPRIQEWRIAAYRTRTKANLKQLMIAIHNYHDRYDSFPPAFVVGPDGQRWHSWRALLLPELDPDLAKEYRMDEPWNGPTNRRLAHRTPTAFQSIEQTPEDGRTSYFAVIGKRTLWPAYQSMNLRDVVDGTSNTIALVESAEPDISWLEPLDMMTSEFVSSLRKGELARRHHGSSVAMADGSVRFLSKDIDGVLLNGLLTPQFSADTFSGDSWPDDLVEKMPQQGLREPVSVTSLPATDLVPVRSTPLKANRNQIWSAAFQMAWDDLKSAAGGTVRTSAQSDLVSALNAAPFDRTNLSSKAVLFGATNGTSGEDAELATRIRSTFSDANYSLQPLPVREGQQALRLMAMIRKQMPFATPFARFRKPLSFVAETGENTVQSFGQEQPENVLPIRLSGDKTFISQVVICDDLGDDSCVIRLVAAGSEADEVIVALTEPKETLEQAWQAVQERIQRPNPNHERRVLDSTETLQIPILNFSLTDHFSELEGLPIEGFDNPAYIALASLDVRLRLDETGAEFVSAGEAGAGLLGSIGDEPYKSDRVRRFIFKRPFFIAMKEPKAREPWFMAWIANTALMEKFDGHSP